jgi:hypothetical protein
LEKIILKKKKDIIANKSSGFSSNEVVANTAKNLYKEINIYDNILNFFNIGFTSPIAKDGFGSYEYQLLNDENVSGTDCYKIRYTPKRKDVLSLYGMVYISKQNYAVVRATIKSSRNINVNFVNGFYNELEFYNPNDSIFLPRKNYQEIQMSIFGKNDKSKSILAKRSTFFSKYSFDQNLNDDIFDRETQSLSDESVQKSDDYWELERKEPLSKSEQNIYKMIDELNKVPKFKKAVKVYETLASGYFNVFDAIDIGDVYSTIGFNDVEGFRLRLGARTYFSPNDMWRAAFYTAYGFKDKQLKYGFEARKMFDRTNRFTIGAGTRRDVMQLGAQLTTDEGIMTRSFASSGVLNSGNNFNLSSVNQTSAFTAIDPLKISH